MSVDPKVFDNINTLVTKNPKNLQADWFAIGFMYAHSLQNKPLEDIFNTINNITLLSRSGALSTLETNDILVRMMNNIVNTEKSNSVPKTNGLNGVGAGTNHENGKKAPQNGKSYVRRSSTIEIEEVSDGKTGLIEDLSYKSDDDLRPKQGGSKPNGKQEDDLLELELTEADYKNLKTADSGYVRKPVSQVDTSDLHKQTNLKRPPKMEEEDLSLELIKQIQEEDAKMQKMIEERKKKEEQESSEATCTICLCSLLDEPFMPLEKCVHMFHEGCLSEYLKSEINGRSFPVRCPANCGQEVAEADIAQVLDNDLMEKFYDYSLQKYVSTHADEISCCPTPNCTYAFDHTTDGEDDNILQCPLCKKTYCLNCRVEYHKNQSCKEYQVSNTKDANDLKFEKFVKGKKYKQCSKCKFWVEKNQGCDHMTCRCKYEFCYKCGGKYRECECVKKMQELAQRRAEQRKQATKNKRKKR